MNRGGKKRRGPSKHRRIVYTGVDSPSTLKTVPGGYNTVAGAPSRISRADDRSGFPVPSALRVNHLAFPPALHHRALPMIVPAVTTPVIVAVPTIVPPPYIWLVATTRLVATIRIRLFLSLRTTMAFLFLPPSPE